MKKLVILAIFALFFFAVSAHAADVTLSWTAPATFAIEGAIQEFAVGSTPQVIITNFH